MSEGVSLTGLQNLSAMAPLLWLAVAKIAVLSTSWLVFFPQALWRFPYTCTGKGRVKDLGGVYI